MRDFTVTAATDYRTADARSSGRRPSGSGTGREPPARPCSMPRRTPSSPCATAGPLSPPVLQGRPVGRRLRHGIAGPDLDPDRSGLGQPALPGRPRDGPPVVLRARRQRPGARAVHRRGRRRLRRPLRPGAQRASRCSTGRLDLSIYPYSATCYYETDLHPGRQPARRGPPADGLDRLLGGAARLHHVTRDALAPTSSLLYALDAATPLDLAQTLFGPRFPRLY